MFFPDSRLSERAKEPLHTAGKKTADQPLEARSFRKAMQIHLVPASRSTCMHVSRPPLRYKKVRGNDTGLQVKQSFFPHARCDLKLPSTAFRIVRGMDFRCYRAQSTPVVWDTFAVSWAVCSQPQSLQNRKTFTIAKK